MEIDAFVELGIVGAGCALDAIMSVAGAGWGRCVLFISKLAGIPLDIVAITSAMDYGEPLNEVIVGCIAVFLLLDRALLPILYCKYGICNPRKSYEKEFNDYLDHFVKQKTDSTDLDTAKSKKYIYGQKTLHIGTMFSSLDYFGAIYRIHSVSKCFRTIYKTIFAVLCILNILIISLSGVAGFMKGGVSLTDVCIGMLFNLTNTIALTQHFVNLSAFPLKKNYNSVDKSHTVDVEMTPATETPSTDVIKYENGTPSTDVIQNENGTPSTDVIKNENGTPNFDGTTQDIEPKLQKKSCCCCRIKCIAVTYFCIAFFCINFFGWFGCTVLQGCKDYGGSEGEDYSNYDYYGYNNY